MVWCNYRVSGGAMSLLLEHIWNLSKGNAIVAMALSNLSTTSFTSTTTNAPNSTIQIVCTQVIPTPRQLFLNIPAAGIVTIVLAGLCAVVVLALYIEQVNFVITQFKVRSRKMKTMWILAFYPVLALSATLGLIVPRAATVVDMTFSLYFSTCLYAFAGLMVDYMGGHDRMAMFVRGGPRHRRLMPLNAPPCCCCCVCLPKIKFNKRVAVRVIALTIQVAILRPMLMYMTGIVLINGPYHPFTTAMYMLSIAIINASSTLLSIYGLLLLRGVLKPELEGRFGITGKLACIQLTLLVASVVDILLQILVSSGVIKCGPMIPAKAKGDMICHAILAIVALPAQLIGRYFFRRQSDGVGYAEPKNPTASQLALMGTMTESSDYSSQINAHDISNQIIYTSPVPSWSTHDSSTAATHSVSESSDVYTKKYAHSVI